MVYKTDDDSRIITVPHVYSLYIDGLLAKEWFFGYRGEGFDAIDRRDLALMEGFIAGLAYSEQMTMRQSELFAVMVITRAEDDGEFTVRFKDIINDNE